MGGLVCEIAGHIPLPGEVMEDGPLRLEVMHRPTGRWNGCEWRWPVRGKRSEKEIRVREPEAE